MIPEGATNDSYAEECLIATVNRVDEIGGYLHRSGVDLLLRGIYLTDRYPDTKLIVECLDTTSSVRSRWSATFPVWSPGPILRPETFAGIVATNIGENAWDKDEKNSDEA